MKIILDGILDLELRGYLLSQEGIDDVDIIVKDFISEISIKFNKKITPLIIMKYIDLFQKNQCSTMLSFKKDESNDFNILKYNVKNMCCEYCYKGLIYDLFENEFINSVKSNFDFYKSKFDIELIIEYDKNYSKEDLIKYIEEKI